MEATKLIKELSALVEKHGDLPVRFCNEDSLIAGVGDVQPIAAIGEEPFEFLLETEV
ncbi:MAG: hypothetical protein AAFR65_10455 [Pseudomonadota bacterium]